MLVQGYQEMPSGSLALDVLGIHQESTCRKRSFHWMGHALDGSVVGGQLHGNIG